MTRPTFAAALLFLASFACERRAPSDDGSIDGSTQRETGAVEREIDDGAVPERCNEATSDVPAANSACVRAVEGSVVQDDAPLSRGFVTVCGPACWAGVLDPSGRFSVAVGEALPIDAYSLLVHGRPANASSYWPLSMTSLVDGIAQFSQPLYAPRYTSEGPALPDSMTLASALVATAGPVTLTFAAGTRLELDFEDFELGELGRRVRVAEVSLERAPPFAREAALIGPVYALAPFALKVSRPVAVAIAHRSTLAPGQRVEFVAMGAGVLDDPPDAGRAVVVARGVVSADGGTITTDPEEGPRTLTWIGVRAVRSP
jgi:stage V sporulation protein SpoVS